MKRLNACLLILLLLPVFFAGAESSYGNLAFALRQQQIINDLRTHCRIPATVTDEKIKSTFLNSSENHQIIIEAASDLRADKRQQYEQALATITCPAAM